MTVGELRAALAGFPQDMPVDAFAHTGYVDGNGLWFDAPIATVEYNEDVWPMRVRLAVEA